MRIIDGILTKRVVLVETDDSMDVGSRPACTVLKDRPATADAVVQEFLDLADD
jgi:hypothetical protein